MTTAPAFAPMILDLATARPAHAALFGDAEARRGIAPGWDLLASVPAPLRQWTRDAVGAVLAQRRQAGDPPLRACFPLGQGGATPFRRLKYIRRLEDYPALTVSAEQGDGFNRAFHQRHVMGGAFVSAQPAGAAAAFSEAGLIDPAGAVGVFAVAPFVLLVDRRRLKNRPTPRRWEELMDPIYRGEVSFGGWRRPGDKRHHAYNSALLLWWAQRFGLPGLEKFLANVSTLVHSAQAPRLAGGNASPAGIYVLPWSLADLCPRRQHVSVVWPEDGALAFPLQLTVKRRDAERLAPLVDYFYSAEYGRYLNQNRYPALSPAAGAPKLDGPLLWPGWEFLRHRGTADLMWAVKRRFHAALDQDLTQRGMRSCA